MRCFAAALVGEYEGDDVIPVLTDILKSKREEPLRACAATGLRRTENPQVIKLLIDALSDEKNGVQDSAQHGLKWLTGQDFGTDQVKYRDWWQKNKDQFLDGAKRH